MALEIDFQDLVRDAVLYYAQRRELAKAWQDFATKMIAIGERTQHQRDKGGS